MSSGIDFTMSSLIEAAMYLQHDPAPSLLTRQQLDAHFDAMPPEFRETDPVIRALVEEALTERSDAMRAEALSRQLVKQALAERAARGYRETSVAMAYPLSTADAWPSLPVYPEARLLVRDGMPLLLNKREGVERGAAPSAYLYRDPYDRALKITAADRDTLPVNRDADLRQGATDRDSTLDEQGHPVQMIRSALICVAGEVLIVLGGVWLALYLRGVL